MCIGIDLVYCFTGRSARLTVQIETLDKNTVIAETSDPYVTFTIQTQLNTFTNVQPSHIYNKLPAFTTNNNNNNNNNTIIRTASRSPEIQKQPYLALMLTAAATIFVDIYINHYINILNINLSWS